MDKINIILFFALLVCASTKPLNPKKVLYAIDCGAPSSHRGPTGIYYERVNYYIKKKYFRMFNLRLTLSLRTTH